MEHVAFIQDGSLVRFKHSASTYMKVCNPITGEGGLVNLSNGSYLPTSAILHYWGLDPAEAFVVNPEE